MSCNSECILGLEEVSEGGSLPISFLGRGTLDIADHPTAVDQANHDSQDY